MALGHFLMAFENRFFIGLLLLIIGNGFFKPNISTQVGNLYPPAIRAATARSRSSTWASTSARSSATSSAERSLRP